MEKYSSLLLGMGGGRESMEQYSSLFLGVWGWTRTYGTIFISVVRRGGGREPMEQYSSLLLGVGVDESLRNNIHHCC